MTAKEKSYRALNDELDKILQDLEDAELDIEDALKLYERGMTIVKELEVYLKTAENKVTKIKASFEQ